MELLMFFVVLPDKTTRMAFVFPLPFAYINKIIPEVSKLKWLVYLRRMNSIKLTINNACIESSRCFYFTGVVIYKDAIANKDVL